MPQGLLNCGTNGVATLDCIFPLLATLIYWALIFAGSVAAIFIIFGGMKFIFSGGDPKALDGAKKTITYAIAGIVLILLSFLIINIIGKITNVACLNSSMPLSFGACQ